MTHDIPWNLLEKHFENGTDYQDDQPIKQWIDTAPENNMIYEQLKQYFGKTGELPVDFYPDTKTAVSKITERILKIRESDLRILMKPTFWIRAASVLLLVCCSWWLIRVNNIKQKSVFDLITTTDSIRSLILPDGSHILINSNSEFKYSQRFSKTREVYLKGEAYFEIKHDKKHPFIVHSGKSLSRVLGTKFNIRSYPMEKYVSLTVTEGTVAFGVMNRQEVTLTKYQKGSLDNVTDSIIKTVNSDPNFLAWKTHEFYFNGLPLESVFTTLAGVYHFKYHFENDIVKKRKLTANFIKRPLDEVIQTIAVSSEISVSLQNDVYAIK